MPPERAREGPARFGVVLGGVAVLLPAACALEFIPDAGIEPLPRAPSRVRGLTQWRGAPVIALDAGASADGLPVRCRHAVLVIEHGHEAVAFLVDAPPRAVATAAAAGESPVPEVAWGSALRSPMRDADNRVWWEMDLRELLQALCDER